MKNLSKKKTESKLQTEEPVQQNKSQISEIHQEVNVPMAQIVRPMVSPAEAKLAWQQYQELKKAFLDPNTDYQVLTIFQVGKGMIKKPFIKKSGWRKLATAFNISVEIVKEERKEYMLMRYVDKKKETSELKPGFVVEITAKAIAMNGRYMYGAGSCASNERDFSKLEHDIRATAETRAKNRAISDLIGGGEVSAEELEQQTIDKQNKCSVDHSNLPDRVVSPGSKNSGRHYVKCEKCNYWKWIDSTLVGAEVSTAKETEEDSLEEKKLIN